MKRIANLITLALMVGAFALPAGVAKADTFVGAGQCSAQLPVWPIDAGSGGECTGVATGAGVGVPGPVVCAPLCAFYVGVHSYQEPCPFPGVPPLIGTAAGALEVDSGTSEATASFNWARVGLTAVLIYPETVGVAAFVPLPPLGGCGAPLPLRAEVAGDFAFAP